MAVLKRRQARQQGEERERLARGEAWVDTGKVFTEADGTWLHPDKVSAAFDRILARTDLPPINLRDLSVGRKTAKTNPARPDVSGRAEETAGQTGIATSPTGRPCRTRTDNQRIKSPRKIMPGGLGRSPGVLFCLVSEARLADRSSPGQPVLAHPLTHRSRMGRIGPAGFHQHPQGETVHHPHAFQMFVWGFRGVRESAGAV
ncbi:hypothetical protein [Streptomyces sp. NPDC001415]